VRDEPQTDDTLGRLLYQLFQTKKSAKAFGERKRTMKIIAYDRMKPGVTYETIEPYLPEEVANVWRLWKAGIVRENYARADELGVVIVFEVESVEAAKRYTDDFPLTKAGFLEWFFISVQVPLPIEVLFNSKVDTKQPYDRTTSHAVAQGVQ
jgi:glycerophosphoryl diester phosphodiesterase